MGSKITCDAKEQTNCRTDELKYHIHEGPKIS